MRFFLSGTLILIIILVSSCSYLPIKDDKLDNDDVIKGLKTALTIGIDSSVKITSSANGYLNHPELKLGLPEETQIIEQNIQQIPGGQSLLNNVIYLINRSAEDAAKSAETMLKNSVTALSISDSYSLLKGKSPLSKQKGIMDFDSTAITDYFYSSCSSQLLDSYAPFIKESMDKAFLGNLSANQAWNDLSKAFNQLVDLDVLNLSGLHKVSDDIHKEIAQMALKGLFIKIGEQEIRVRHNPWLWVTDSCGDILTKVFSN